LCVRARFKACFVAIGAQVSLKGDALCHYS
jgi:hypothetical protein